MWQILKASLRFWKMQRYLLASLLIYIIKLHRLIPLPPVQRFFQEGLSAKSPVVVAQGAAPALPDAEISKYAQTASLQIDVTAFLQSQVEFYTPPPPTPSLPSLI